MVILHSGHALPIDLYQMSLAEYRSLFDATQPPEVGDAIIAKVVGLTVAELTDLPQPDYRRVVQAVFKAAREPLADIDDPKA